MNSTSKIFVFPVLLFIGILSPFDVLGQDPFYVNYQTQDGLPSSMTYAVFQDSKGYIWVGTDSGVSRFDGKSFKNFSYQDGLADNEVFNFFEDSRGRIWIHTFNGQACYWEQGKFYNSKNKPILQSVSLENYITHICEDSDGFIHLSSNGGNGVSLSTTNEIIPFFAQEPTGNINFTWTGKDNTIFMSYQHGIIKNDSEKKHTYYNQIVNNFSPGFTRGIDIGDKVFLALKKHIFLFDKTTEQLILNFPVKEINTEIIHIKHYNGNLWLGTRNGAFKIEPTQPNFESYKIKKYLDGHSVSSILLDKEGNIWFSTLESGLFFSTAPNGMFLKKKEGLPENQIFCISEDPDKRLWIGSTKNKFSIYENNNFSIHKLAGSSNLEVSKIRHFGSDEHWVLGQGLMMLYDENLPTYIFNHTDDIIKDQFGYYWLGHKRLVRLSSEEITKILIPENDKYFFKNSRFPVEIIKNKTPVDIKRFICYESNFKNRIWAGTTTGLYWYEYNETTITNKSGKNLVDGKITDLIYDKSTDLLWVATSSDGIHIIQNDTILATVNESDGLSNNIATSLYLDEQFNIWVGTTNGVERLSWEEGYVQIHHFSKEHGLYNLKVNDIHVKDKQVYVATESGLIILPVTVNSPKVKPPIYINTFKVNDQITDWTQTNVYKHYQNSVEFSFTGISYHDQGNITYLYRLLGEHEAWKETQTSTIQYRSLAPSKYQFQVKAKTTLLRESQQPAIIAFEINAPFWQKAWFIALVIVSLFLVILLLWKKRIRSLKNQHQLEQRLIYAENTKLELEKNFLDLEMRALRLQMNPHFIFNALNTIKGYYAQHRIREANAFISKFAQLLRLILKNNDKYISLEKEIKILNYYMQLTQIRYENIFDYDIQINPAIDQQDVAIPPMLLQPMVENAILHGLVSRKEKGNIFISFEAEDGVLISKVRDNGIGRAASAKHHKHKIHTSKATQITQDRLAIINKNYKIINYFKIDDLTNQDGSAIGTEVTIKTPFKTIWS